MMRRVALSLLMLLSTMPASGQSYFGQNQVQYDSFKWKMFETEHFQIFYYASEARAAVDAGSNAASAVGTLVSAHVIARPSPSLMGNFIKR